MKYTPKVIDGKVSYLMKAGKDIVKAETTEQNALWMMQNKPTDNDCLEGFPEYCIHAGDFYFLAEPQKPSRRRKKDAVCA